MKVKNLEALKRIALERGVRAELDDGTLVNGGRNRIDAKATPAVAPKTPDPIPPVPEREHGESDDESAERMARTVLAAVQMALDSRTEPMRMPEPPKSWEFSVERDKNGLLTKIRATPIVPLVH